MLRLQWSSIFLLVALVFVPSAVSAKVLPDPVFKTAPVTGLQQVVFAGGCFWGVQGVFQHVRGVKEVVSGYAGGDANTASYEVVSTGETGHAESVNVTYDPSEISLGQLLKIFFAVAHDPTELNRQGPDVGPQYRSAIFTTTPEQQENVRDYVAQLEKAKVFSSPIVTKVEKLETFYPAEAYHQDYMRLHPFEPYILINDRPKVSALKQEMPELYREP